MGSITLTNIPQFIEQPGRIITKSIGALDIMTVPFLGPWNIEVPFKEGSPDTIYSKMFCSGYTETDNGGLHELSVKYAGRTDNDWQNEVLMTRTASEKELTYSTLTAFSSLPVTPGTQGAISTYGLNNFCLHYVGEIITYKYVYYGTAIPKIATTAVIYSQYSIHTGKGSSVTVAGTPIGSFLQEQFPGPYGYSGPHQRLTQFTFTQVIDQWYECQSTTEARYEVP